MIKDYGAFKMTVDDAGTPLGAELEWVVDPPIEESADVNQLEGIMGGLVAECAKLLALRTRESFLLSEVSNDAADDTVELQPGAKGPFMADMQAQAQVTGGVSIDHLIDLFHDLAMAEGHIPTPNAQEARNELHGANEAEGMVSAAANVVGSARLKGLVAMVHRYLDMAKRGAPPSYAKKNTQFLARTDFARMFALLPGRERRAYSGAHADDFVVLICDATGFARDRQIYAGGIGARDDVKRIDLTIESWLRGITEGVDKLTDAYWKQAGKDKENLNKAQRRAARSNVGYLESMGSLGAKVDDVGDANRALGIVIEFRNNTDQQPVEQWKTYAVTVFRYLKALNRRG